MIAKKVPKKADVADNYTGLGEYIAAGREEGEKLDKFWTVNCNAGTELKDLEMALIEVEATRAMKPEIDNKTYHLMVSFRPGEREKLSLEDLKDIEREFAKALGFAAHQRVVGTHINTDNFHMHVAYNMLHAATLKLVRPWKDYQKLEQTARRLEQKYGLYVDRGMSDREPGKPKKGQQARNFEAQTWQQSFETHLRKHKTEILAAIGAAKTWREVHEAVAPFDASLCKRGAGLVFKQITGRWTMKASALGRSCSLKALEERLGPYQPAPAREKERRPAPRFPYLAKPLVAHPGQDRLWRLYRAERKAPGFFERNVFNIRSWKEYLLADAHKDLLALAIIVTYREALRSLEGAPSPRSASKAITPALRGWFASLPWGAPETALPPPGYLPGAGLKVDGEERVLFAMRDVAGRVWAIQAVDQGGRTCILGDMSARPGLRHVIDRHGHLASDSASRGPIVLATNCAAAIAVHKATGLPVIVAGRERDLPELARELLLAHPRKPITIAASENSRAAIDAARAVGGRVTTPEALIVEVSHRSPAARGEDIGVSQQ